MSKTNNNPAPSITQDQINKLIADSEIEVRTIFEKVTLVAVRLPSGFVLTESAGAVSKANYSQEQGARIFMQKIESQLWKLEGYRLSCAIPQSAIRIPQS